MIVLDASAAVSALLNAGEARRSLADEAAHVPHLIDAEIAHALRRQVLSRSLGADDGWAALDTWRRLGVVRHPMGGLLDRVWELRENVSAYDASYLALAEALGCALLTADGRLSRVPGLRCAVTVVPR
ncbi:type II toxin-antitoxin system VapC family toxin [Geodermatophilus sp. URMC 61]|uniref:type II toxin-antitoxin system VapC family toxin n=1 Tax=Geodermatophilus sp. URMC 61 TaxID=3423411 RepID=UPI00406C7489